MPHREAIVVVVVSALDMVVRGSLVLGLGGVIVLVIHGELAVEVVDLAEVSRSAARVKLPRPE
jgi:hypothetical protein